MKKLLTAIAGAALISLFVTSKANAAYLIKSIDTDTTGFKDIIDEFQQFVHGSGIPFQNSEAQKLDPTKLILATDHDVRVYFLNEGAGFKNQLEFTATNGSNSQSGLIFENISCHVSNTDCRKPSEDGVLNIGDYVELGNFSAGTQFDFRLIADGFNGGKYVYGADPNSNPDKLSHLVAYEYLNYLVIGFEDLYGPLGATDPPNQKSDRDFEDAVFVIEMPVAKQVPESSTSFALIGVGAFGLVKIRRHTKKMA